MESDIDRPSSQMNEFIIALHERKKPKKKSALLWGTS